MGKKQRRSRRLANKAEAFDFYQQLYEVERRTPHARRRDARSDDEPFGEGRRRRNRRSRRADHARPERWEEAG